MLLVASLRVRGGVGEAEDLDDGFVHRAVDTSASDRDEPDDRQRETADPDDDRIEREPLRVRGRHPLVDGRSAGADTTRWVS